MTNYYELKGYFTSSEIKEYLIDPLSWEERYYKGVRFVSEAMKMGTLIHQAVLEPEDYIRATLTRPEGIKLNTKEGKAWKEANKNKVTLTGKQEETINGILASLEKSYSLQQPFKDSGNILNFLRSKTKVEQEFINDALPLTEDIKRPVKLKCDAYWMQDKILNIIDVKSANESFFSNPIRSIKSGRYDAQGAWYGVNMMKMLGAEDFVFSNLFVETAAPFRVKLVVYPTHTLKAVYNQCVEAVLRIERDRKLLDQGKPTSYHELPIQVITEEQIQRGW
jgi:hypothetical protein